MGPVQLLEREAELAAIGEALSSASGGRGSVLVIEGAAGIGKTALLQSARLHAPALGVRPLVARGSELERDFPFGVVRQLLEPPVRAESQEERGDLFRGAAAPAARVLGEPRDAAVAEPGAEAGFNILNALHWVVAGLGDRAPVALLVDDLHWADPESVRFVLFLARRIGGLACVMIVAARARENDTSDAALSELRALSDAQPVRPQPLSEAGVAALLRAATDASPTDAVSAACLRLSAGNPLLLTALIRAILDEAVPTDDDNAERIAALAPESVNVYVERRLRSLGADATRLAQAAAIVCEPVALGFAVELASLSSDGLDVAERLRDVEIFRSADPIAFTHPLIRQAVRGTLSLAQRDQLNHAAMLHFRALGSDRERAAAHALAVRGGRGDPLTVELLRSMAHEALSRGAPDPAIAYLQRAVEEPPPAGERAAILRELGIAQGQRGLFTAADTLRTAFSLAETPEERARIAFDLGGVYEAFFDWPAAVDALELARAELSSEDAFTVEVEAELVVTTMYDPSGIGRAPARIEFLGRHSASAAARKTVAAATATARLALAGDRSGAIAAAEEALQPELLGIGSFHATFNAWVVLLDCEEHDRLRAHLERGFASPQLTALGRSLSGLHFVRGWLSLVTGALDEARAELESAMAVNADLDWRAAPDFYADGLLAEVAIELGETSRAARHVERLGDDTRWAASPGLFAYWARARLREATGDPEGALADLRAGESETRRWFGSDAASITGQTWRWRAWAALMLDRLGRGDEALIVAHAELAGARSFGAPGGVAAALRALGTVTRSREGVGLLREAVAASERSGLLLERARCLLALGSALRRIGHRSEAREPLRHALDIAAGAGAAALAAAARAEIEASGGRPRRDRLSGTEALTPSERRVTELAADGLTNRQIAQTLYLSPKTVEMHLSRAYRKLAVRSRNQLGRALATLQSH